MFALNALSVTASNAGVLEAIASKPESTTSEATNEYKWAEYGENLKKPLNEVLSTFHDRTIQDFYVKRKNSLHKEVESKAVLVEFSSDLLDNAYAPGDHMGVCPQNTSEQVSFLKRRLTKNPQSDVPLTLQDCTRYPWVDLEDFPKFVNFDNLLRYFVDLRQTPSQEVLNVFVRFATDNIEKETLKDLCSDNEAYEMWKADEKGICETLEEFKSVTISSANLMSRMKLIKPRLYSIASSPSKGNVDLVIGVVEYTTTSGVEKKGLATSNLVRAEVDAKIPGFLRSETSFHLPKDPSKPVIMICAGSGIAPFRGFWKKRYEQHLNGEMVSKTLLYFGCRNKSMNLLTSETGSMCGLNFDRVTAYSREHGQKKQYVQQAVLQDGARVFMNWIERGGFVYVCGKIDMARDVGDSLKNILMKFEAVDEKSALEKIDCIKDERRYQEDIFG